MSDTQVHSPMEDQISEGGDSSVESKMMRMSPLGQSNWEEEAEPKPKRKNRVKSALFILSLGFVSFFFFLYLSFPYGVLKEVASSKITDELQARGNAVSLRIGSLKPYWFTGIELTNVVIKNVTDPTAVIKLGEITARVSVLPLLMGRLGISARVTQAGGYLELDAKIPISSILKGAPSPRTVEVDLKNFALDGFFNHLLAIPKASKDPGMMLIQPILLKTTAGGSLSGKIAFENIDKMTGAIAMNVSNLFLHINDDTLKIPQQNFSTAKIDLKYQNNTMTFANTKFESPDMGIEINGNITIPEVQNDVTQANLDIVMTMHGEVEKNLGMIVPNLMRCKPLANGELKAKLQGPITQMTCL